MQELECLEFAGVGNMRATAVIVDVRLAIAPDLLIDRDIGHQFACEQPPDALKAAQS